MKRLMVVLAVLFSLFSASFLTSCWFVVEDRPIVERHGDDDRHDNDRQHDNGNQNRDNRQNDDHNDRH